MQPLQMAERNHIIVSQIARERTFHPRQDALQIFIYTGQSQIIVIKSGINDLYIHV